MKDAWQMPAIGRTVAAAMARNYVERGKRIAELRQQANLSQDGAAHRAGVTVRAWQEWEAGGGMRPANIEKAAEALGVPREQITGQAELADPFSLARHLDDRVEEFRRYSVEMTEALARVEAKLDALAALAAGLLDGGAIQPGAWTQGVQEAARLLRAEPAADEHRARRTAKRGRG